MSVLRKLLLTIMVLGATTSTVSAGTFASFNASTSNTATFATGNLALSNQKGVATACLSTGGGGGIDTNVNACDSLFGLTVQKPGDSAFVDLTLSNSGTLPGTLRVSATGDCTNGAAPGQTYSGGGLPCNQLQMYIQEYTTLANRTAGTTTGGQCVYGNTSGSACTGFNANYTLDSFDSLGSPISIGTLPALTSGTCAASPLPTGTCRYFRVYISLPATSDNTFQGTQATFGFDWALAQ